MVRVELYINNTLIPLSEELSIPLNFQISDVQKPETRQGNFSKTVNVPGSKAIDKLFGYFFELNVSVDSSGTTNFSPDFNPNLKADAIVLNDGVEVFNGVAQLVDIKIRDKNDIMYSIVLYSKLRNLFDDIGDKELRDLDFSEYDHEYNRTNVTNSWDTYTRINGVNTAFQYGRGYVYPLIDYGFSSDLINFNLINLYPALPAREYLAKIFEDAGYTWDSAFLDSAYFKRLYIPYSSPYMRMTSAQILARRFRASRASTDLTYSVTTGYSSATDNKVLFNNDSTAPNFDSSTQYNTGTGIFTVGTGLQGNFSFSTVLRLGMVLTPTTPAVSYRQVPDLNVYVKIIKEDAGGTKTIVNSYNQIIRHLSYFTTSYTTANPATLPDSDFTALNNPANYVQVTASNVDLIATDKVYVEVTPYLSYSGWLGSGVPWLATPFVTSGGTYGSGTIQLKIYTDSYFMNNIDNSQIVEGQTVYVNNTIPDKVKQKDFVLSLIRMFNLYFEQDPDNTNKFKIEPRIDYYNNTVQDWTQKLDYNSDLVKIPMGALDVKAFEFKYKEDKDYFNQTYSDRYKEVYGERNIEVVNDFVKGTKTIELIFSPTPSVGNEASNRIIPRIVKIDDYGQVSNHEGNIRILYYDGLKSSNQLWNIVDNGGSTAFDEYPYMGMVDDPYNPIYDIGFGVPAELYWQPIFDSITYTNNNLFNKYWREFILEIINPSSAIVRGKFRLTPLDVFKLDFRSLYYFDNCFFRLNRVIDYNPIANELTECEFIKVYKGVSFTALATQLDGSLDVMNDNELEIFTGLLTQSSQERMPSFNITQSKNGGTVRRYDSTGVDYGYGNRVGSNVQGYFILGNYNTIGDNATSITMIDSSGCTVAGGTNGIKLIGCRNLEVVESGVTVIDNVYVKGDNATFTTTQNFDMSDRVNKYFIDTTAANKTFYLLTAEGREGREVTIKNIGTNTLRIRPNDGETLDGAAFLDVVTQYDSVTITSNGTDWYII